MARSSAKKAASKKPSAKRTNTAGKDKDKDKECTSVLKEYFEKTARMLAEQEQLCHKAVYKIKKNDYNRHDLREDWRKSVDRTVAYGRMATRAWVDYSLSCRWWGPFGSNGKI